MLCMFAVNIHQHSGVGRAHHQAPGRVQEGGALYTWGGVAAAHGRGARDHTRGCLGLGDTAGRLVPTQCARACQLCPS